MLLAKLMEGIVTTREVSYNLAGVVRNMSLPVAGTTIVVYDYWNTGSGLSRHFLAEQNTGVRGEFSFDVRKGIYSIEVIPNRDTRFARQSIDIIKVIGNTSLTINLKHGCTYQGKVKTFSGDVVAGCQLLFIGIEPEPVRATEFAGADGYFSVTLPKGKYHVACKNPMPDKTAVKLSSESFLSPTLQVLELWRDRREDIALPEMVAFKGAVTNAEGHPVPAARVNVTPSAPADPAFASDIDLKGVCFTDKKGQFQCMVEPANYDVKVEPGPESHLSERQVSAILVDQARTRTYSLGQGYRIEGQVTFDGSPVSNALVSVLGGKIDSFTLTDDEGMYSFSLSGGKYQISVNAQPDSLARLPFRLLSPYTCPVNLAEDTEINVSLQQGVVLSGVVADKHGNPLPGVQLALYENKGDRIDTTAGVQQPLTFSITGDDGSYEFRVSEGKYWLIINNQQATAQAVTIMDRDVTENLVWQTGCLVNFKVVSEFDEPISHCIVYCEEYAASVGVEPQELFHATTNDDGTCNIVVQSGIYSFRFAPPEQGSFEEKTLRQFSVSTDVQRKVKLAMKQVAAKSEMSK
jgi:uncharacterized GH25 family protein